MKIKNIFNLRPKNASASIWLPFLYGASMAVGSANITIVCVVVSLCCASSWQTNSILSHNSHWRTLPVTRLEVALSQWFFPILLTVFLALAMYFSGPTHGTIDFVELLLRYACLTLLIGLLAISSKKPAPFGVAIFSLLVFFLVYETCWSVYLVNKVSDSSFVQEMPFRKLAAIETGTFLSVVISFLALIAARYLMIFKESIQRAFVMAGIGFALPALLPVGLSQSSILPSTIKIQVHSVHPEERVVEGGLTDDGGLATVKRVTITFSDLKDDEVPVFRFKSGNHETHELNSDAARSIIHNIIEKKLNATGTQLFNESAEQPITSQPAQETFVIDAVDNSVDAEVLSYSSAVTEPMAVSDIHQTSKRSYAYKGESDYIFLHEIVKDWRGSSFAAQTLYFLVVKTNESFDRRL